MDDRTPVPSITTWTRVRDQLVAKGWQPITFNDLEGVKHPGDGTAVLSQDITDPKLRDVLITTLGMQIRGLRHKPPKNQPPGWTEHVLKVFQELLDAVTAVDDNET